MTKVLAGFLSGFAVFLSFAVFLPGQALADHSWGNYHWARTSNPFVVPLGNNVSSVWQSSLSAASADWSSSSVLDMITVAGGVNPKNCRPGDGRVEVCNEFYGNNGWLGIAQIWVSGSHISKGAVKMNDSYFSASPYNTSAWRNLVMCQEIGHTLGLDHQDEDFSNSPLGTCMDYSNDPLPNQHPNQHDFDQLEAIYAHLDAAEGGSSKNGKGNGRGNNGDLNNRSEWGKQVKNNGHVAVFERLLTRDQKIFTFVVWAQE